VTYPSGETSFVDLPASRGPVYAVGKGDGLGGGVGPENGLLRVVDNAA
jgi:hypothetical protein